MIKVFQINASSDAGGGPQVMWDIVQGLKNYFDFIILAPEGFFMEKYRRLGFQNIVLTRFKIFQIRRQIKKQAPDIIHVHGTRAAFWTRLSVLFLKDRPNIIYTLHGLHIVRRNFSFIFLFLERILNHFVDVLVCVSQADRALVLKHKIIDDNKIVVVRNGIDLSKFGLAPPGKSKIFTLLSVGRLHPQKDFSTLIKAMSIINKKIKLLIVGEGPLRENLEYQIKKLNLGNKVFLLGKRNDVPKLMALCDGVVLSSNWEGLALVPLEAGSVGKVVIASKIGGIEESIVDGETGFLFEKGCAQNLAQKIEKLYNLGADNREKMGQRAHQHIAANFSKEKMIENYRLLYNS